MLTYYIDNTNSYTLRTLPITTTDIVMEVQDMYTNKTSNATLTNVEYSEYESILQFTASISTATVSSDWRVKIKDNGNVVWNGSLTVFGNEVQSKSEYETQTTQYKSKESSNEYIIQ